MIAVDTNVIVRLLTGDDVNQAKKARLLIEGNDVFIADTVLLEAEWVLRYAYGFSVSEINRALTGLLGLPRIQLNHPRQVASALKWHAQGMDFADALHLAVAHAQDAFYTFDKEFIKKADHLNLLPGVESP